jgi:hypothetical protein
MKFGVAAAAFCSMGLAASASQAAVYIGLSNDGGVTVLQQTDLDPSSDAALFSGVFGAFNLNLVTGSYPGGYTLLDSTTNNATTTTGGTLDVFVTRDFVTAPLNLSFKSAFTANSLPTGWTVQQRTYVDAANVKFSTANLLGDVTFSAAGTNTQFDLPVAGAGPYSVTSRYTITAPSAGSSLSTITLTAVPEPGTWALMILGFGGAGAMLRSRRREAAVQA